MGDLAGDPLEDERAELQLVPRRQATLQPVTNEQSLLPSEQPRYGVGETSFLAAGGREGLTALVDAFYRIMDELPEARTIRRMHPRDLDESRDKLMRFLCGWLNGPKLFAEKYGPIKLPAAHEHLHVGPAERDAWLDCMERAVAEQDYAPAFSSYLLEQLRRPAERIMRVSRGARAG